MSKNQSKKNIKKKVIEQTMSGTLTDSVVEKKKDLSEKQEDTASPDASEISKYQLKIKVCEENIESLQKECAKNEELYLRVLADCDNQRKRHEKEKSSLQQFALEDFFKSILPVLDSLDKTILNLPKEQDSHDKTWLQGIELVVKQLKESLEKAGLESVPASGKKFDPNFHQALQKKESDDVREETVDQEFVKGYLLNGRLIRASMVSILSPKGE